MHHARRSRTLASVPVDPSKCFRARSMDTDPKRAADRPKQRYPISCMQARSRADHQWLLAPLPIPALPPQVPLSELESCPCRIGRGCGQPAPCFETPGLYPEMCQALSRSLSQRLRGVAGSCVDILNRFVNRIGHCICLNPCHVAKFVSESSDSVAKIVGCGVVSLRLTTKDSEQRVKIFTQRRDQIGRSSEQVCSVGP